MAAKNYYLTATTGNSWRTIDEATQTAATSADGWVVSTGLTNHSEYEVGVERAASTFTGTTVPDGTLDTTLKDAFRTTNALNGDFASANWVLHFVVRATTVGGAQDGRIRFRLIKADADGSNATEITAGHQQASIVSNVSTSADFDSTLTFNPGAFSMAGQYLFIQIAWERTGAGGMTTSDINWRTGSSTTAGTRFVTSDFTLKVNGGTITSGHTLNAAHSVALAVTGATIASGSSLSAAHAVALVVDGATISGTALTAGSVTLVVDGATIASGTALFAGTVTAAGGGDTVEGVHISSTAALTAGSVTLGVDGATISGTTLTAGSVTLVVDGATIASTTTLTAGSVALEVNGGTIASTTTLTAGTVSQRVDGAHRSATSSLFAPSVALVVEGATLASGHGLFAGTVSAAGTVSGAHIAATTTLNAGTVSMDVTGAHRASTLSLFSGTPALVVDGAHRASAHTLLSGTLSLDVTGATLSGATQLSAGSVALAVSGTHLATTVSLFAGTVVSGPPTIGGAHIVTTVLYAGTIDVPASVSGGLVVGTVAFTTARASAESGDIASSKPNAGTFTWDGATGGQLNLDT